MRREFYHHQYNSAGRENFTLFSQAASHSTQQHLAAQGHSVESDLGPLVDQRLGPERAPAGCGGRMQTRPFPQRSSLQAGTPPWQGGVRVWYSSEGLHCVTLTIQTPYGL